MVCKQLDKLDHLAISLLTIALSQSTTRP